MMCRGPVLAHLRQYWPEYGPAAHHSRVITFLLHIFGGFQYSKLKLLRLKREIINTFRKKT